MAQDTSTCGAGPLSRFRNNHLDAILTQAKSSEHLKSPYFEPVYKAIEKYVATHNLIVSNSPGATTRQYRIFGARIFFHANDLAGEIADLIPYVRMNTVVREKEFEIHVDGVKLVWLYNIDPTFAKIIAPCANAGGANAELNKLPAEVELVDVYHRLYSPDQFKSWPRLGEYEAELWQEFISSRKAIETCDRADPKSEDELPTAATSPSSDFGSARSHVRRRGSRDRSRGRSRDRSTHGGSGPEYLDIVLSWLKEMREYAIVGTHALARVLPDQCSPSGVIQIIVGNVPSAISSLTKRLEQFIPKAIVEVRMYDLQLPTDYRIKKHVVIVRIGRDVHYVANLFNCAGFELIPVKSPCGYTGTQDGIILADFPVLLRFLFIEIWFTRMVHGFGKMTSQEYSRIVNALVRNINAARAIYLTEIANAPDVIAVPPRFIGVYVNESISKKSNEMVAPYFPAQYKANNGEYRDLRKQSKVQ